jgi:hypothetical protein
MLFRKKNLGYFHEKQVETKPNKTLVVKECRVQRETKTTV